MHIHELPPEVLTRILKYACGCNPKRGAARTNGVRCEIESVCKAWCNITFNIWLKRLDVKYSKRERKDWCRVWRENAESKALSGPESRVDSEESAGETESGESVVLGSQDSETSEDEG